MQNNLTNRFDRLAEKVNELSKLNEDVEKLSEALLKSYKPPKEVRKGKKPKLIVSNLAER